jgi:hypothetical protein
MSRRLYNKTTATHSQRPCVKQETLRLTLLSLAALCFAANAAAQTSAQLTNDPEQPSLLSTVPTVPGISAYLRGFNGGVSLTSVHDSSSGWYTLLTPALSYSVSPHYSVDISMPLYLYRLAESQVTIDAQPASSGQPSERETTHTELEPHTFDPGDIILAAHANTSTRSFATTFTPSITLPTGDSTYGLSTGRVTFDLDEHMQFQPSHVAFLLDLGGGDSSSLFNRLVTQNYTSLGPLAHFQTGLLVPMPFRGSFQSVAYEQLPLGDNKIYTTLTRPGFPTQTVISGRSVSEDNGFTNSLTLPLTGHITWQAYYNRSLRLHLDTVAVGLTFVLHKPASRKRTEASFDNFFEK